MTEDKIRLSLIVCSDKRMDIVDTLRLVDTPVNKYKISCDKCKFPDIDDTPNPYYLAKRRIFSGIEIMIADLGNLLVSERVKKVFELLLPNACNYQRTFIEDSNISTNWWLAIPINTILSGEVKDDVQRCDECNQPLYANPGSQYTFWTRDLLSDHDIIKSTNWHSISNVDWKSEWISRDAYLSLRLISLLRKISAKGIYQAYGSKFKGLTKKEKDWVSESLNKIGSLKDDDTRKDLTSEDIERLKGALELKEINDEKVENFERKYKRKPSELFQLLCSVDKETELNLGDNEKFIIDKMDNWESIRGNKKLIKFAQDNFGNSLQFDVTNKLCPIYHFDHETMTYDQTHKSILDLIE